jgi:hypothetical protein
MARDPEKLNDVQYEVLCMVAKGAKNALEDRGRRITAKWLDARGFLIVDGHGRHWTARITESGLRAREGHRLRVAVPREEVERLYAALDESGGRLPVIDFETPASAVELLNVSLRSPSRPFGKRLEHQLSYGTVGIPQFWLLVEHAEDSVAVSPIDVPEKVKHFNPALEPFRRDRVATGLSVDQFNRASRILQAIALEAESRGYGVATGDESDRRSPGRATSLRVVLRGDVHPVSISLARPSVSKGRPWLQLKLPHSEYSSGEGKWWFVDTTRRTLEACIPDFFRKLEITQLINEERAAQRRVEEARRHVAQEKALAAAKLKFQFDHKVTELRSQVSRYNEAVSIREYVAHVRANRSTEDAAAEAWMVWVEDFANSLDPALGDLGIPEDRAYPANGLRS